MMKVFLARLVPWELQVVIYILVHDILLSPLVIVTLACYLAANPFACAIHQVFP